MLLKKCVVGQKDSFTVLDLEKLKEWFDGVKNTEKDYWDISLYYFYEEDRELCWYFRVTLNSNYDETFDCDISEEQAKEIIGLLDMLEVSNQTNTIDYQPRKILASKLEQDSKTLNYLIEQAEIYSKRASRLREILDPYPLVKIEPLFVILSKEVPNKKCVLNVHVGGKLKARNLTDSTIEVKLEAYNDWFTIPLNCVTIQNK